MICIQFSKRREADLFYNSVVKEQELWLLKDELDYYEVTLENENKSQSTFREIVQACLQVIRARKWLGWMEGVLRHTYYYEDRREIDRILEIGREFEGEPPSGLAMPPVYRKIQSFLENYVTLHSVINFDDMCADCLEDSHRLIAEYTGFIIDEYKQEEAYQLLLDSWRFRVQNRDTGVTLLHLYQNNGLTYFHDEGNPISESETLLYMKQYPDESIKDLPLHWCITPALVLAPDQLVIYTNKPDDPHLELIRNIFEEKATWKAQSEFPFKMS
ncbi:sporulation protein YtxC [Halobacillus mangrovi]|uniref:Sporulation protein YtxC n=1 Tax=Halobacillus mangrovi TaxID=402384 RepID=A0A1W5ZU77_9BACI|nr:sporulation protein YtxC [Halobacillus mangrovi]ARI76839.1 hypothetical protein HM131_08285 [Halobacillus mangrovi]